MGIEYALVHPESNEAFELGKGPWSELWGRRYDPPRSPTREEML